MNTWTKEYEWRTEQERIRYSRLVFKNFKATEKILQEIKGISDKISGNKIIEIQKDFLQNWTKNHIVGFSSYSSQYNTLAICREQKQK